MRQAPELSGPVVARVGAHGVLGALVVLSATAIGAPSGAAAAAANAAASASAPASAAGDGAPQPVPRRTDLIGLTPLVPRLAEADRRAMRLQARALRDHGAAPSPAWALVAAPSADRRQSERIALRIQAIVGGNSAIPRAETMRSGATWRAVVWPYGDADAAEQARRALAARGLRTEVVEF